MEKIFILATWEEIVYNNREYASVSDALCSILVYERTVYMSASNKKKLRKEQAAEMLTEKQRQEQAEITEHPQDLPLHTILP